MQERWFPIHGHNTRVPKHRDPGFNPFPHSPDSDDPGVDGF